MMHASVGGKAKRIVQILDEMAELFVFGDKLLATEGPIPVYYWLVRNSTSEARWLIRDFLSDFNAWQETPQLYELSNELKADLAAYGVALRSVNDKTSHEARFTILTNWFEKWGKGLKPQLLL